MTTDSKRLGVPKDRTGAPKADAALIARAQEAVGSGEKLNRLFVNPSAQVRAFMKGLTLGEKAALENLDRPTE